MTATAIKVVTLACDAPDCRATYDSAPRELASRVRGVRFAASADGWTYVRLDGEWQDRCPWHTTRDQRQGGEETP